MPKRRRSSAKSKAPVSGAGNSSRLRRWLTVLLWTVGIGVLTAAVLLVAAAAVLLSPPPAPMAPFSAEDAQLQQRILSKVYGEVFNRRPPVEAQLRLTPDEMNSLLRCMVFTVSAAEQFGAVKPAEAEAVRSGHYTYRPGNFTVEIPIARVPAWFFGGAAVLRLEGFPAKYEGKFDIALKSCRIGRLPLPAGEVERLVNRELAKELRRDDMLCFDRAVKSFEAQSDGSVIVIYRPPELLRLLVGRKASK